MEKKAEDENDREEQLFRKGSYCGGVKKKLGVRYPFFLNKAA